MVDCGALRAAHAGISLSEAEASVASPFTSRRASIACVPVVMAEGRAGLVTSLSVFRFMALYSLTQFVSVLVLYAIDTNVTDSQFLFVDLFIVILIGLTMGNTSASLPLSIRRPMTKLVSIIPILSIVLHILIMSAFQLLVFFWVQHQEWYSSICSVLCICYSRGYCPAGCIVFIVLIVLIVLIHRVYHTLSAFMHEYT